MSATSNFDSLNKLRSLTTGKALYLKISNGYYIKATRKSINGLCEAIKDSGDPVKGEVQVDTRVAWIHLK